MPLLPLDPTDNFDGGKVEQLLALVDAVQPAMITLNLPSAQKQRITIPIY